MYSHHTEELHENYKIILAHYFVQDNFDTLKI